MFTDLFGLLPKFGGDIDHGEQYYPSSEPIFSRREVVMAPKETTEERACRLIDEMDLTRVKCSVLRQLDDGGLGWTREQADEAEEWYKMFLKLHILCPGEALIPPKSADYLWHAHILFTEKYIDDCNRIFGYYFHHRPFDKQEVADIGQLSSDVGYTRSLFLRHFKKAPETFHWFCNNCSCWGPRQN